MGDLQKFRARKKELHYTNEQIAQLSGIPKRTIEDFFRGASQDPRRSTVQAIERALGLSEEGYRDTMPFEITPMEEELIHTFRALSAEDKQLFLILMKKLSK